MVGACQQNSGIFLVRGGEADGMPAGAEAGLAAGSERDADGCRGWARSGQGPDEMPAGAEAGTGQDADDQITGAGGGLGATRDRARCRRAGIGWQSNVTAANRCWVEADAGGAEAGLGVARDRTRCRRENHLKRKRSIISSSNSGFSKSFSLVMIRLLCSQNPASW